MEEKLTIEKLENNCIIIEDDLSILSKINRIIVRNELQELATNILEKNKTDTTIKFYINKQAAYNNQFHMIDENMSPLGDIEVCIETDAAEEVIKWITS
jgi:predicted RNA binding protein with dsRBD fold (UPF0201 family)